jgi:Protein of unknown function (DUF3105)
VPKDSSRRNDTRRVNKDRRARLEELRRQQKAAERRKNFLFIGSAIVIAIALIAAVLIPAYLHDQANKNKSKAGHQAKPTAAEKAAGCLGVHNDPVPKDSDRSHVATAVDYAKTQFGDTKGGTLPVPPTGGHHNQNTLSDTNRFYPLAQKPRPERAVHNLEHGYVVVWYDSKLPADQVAHLQLLAGQGNLSRMLVVGWWQGDLPANKHVVITSWARTDRCSTVSDKVINDFYKANLNASIAPEATLTMAGDPNLPADQLGAAAPAPSTSTSPSPSSTKK